MMYYCNDHTIMIGASTPIWPYAWQNY